MTYGDLSSEEKLLRQKIAKSVRAMVSEHLTILEEDETSLMADYCGYYLQISFSELHPLMVFCLAKSFEHTIASRRDRVNDLNLKSILGSHAINDEIGCYSYRATHWLDIELNPPRFFEILDRCVDEAERGYRMLMQ